MLFPKAARPSCFPPIPQPANASVKRPIQALAALAAGCLLLLTSATTARATELFNIYEVGRGACEQVLDAEDGFLLGGTDYRAAMQEAGMDRYLFCRCVSSEFAVNEPLQSFRMALAGNDEESAEVFGEILAENLTSCLSPDNMYGWDSEPGEADVGYDLCADGCQDGPIWADDSDRLHCEFAIDGTLTPSRFDLDETLAWIDRSGVDAESLCGCAAAVLEDRADEYATELEASSGDTELYWEYMDQAVSECRMAIWRG